VKCYLRTIYNETIYEVMGLNIVDHYAEVNLDIGRSGRTGFQLTWTNSFEAIRSLLIAGSSSLSRISRSSIWTRTWSTTTTL